MSTIFEDRFKEAGFDRLRFELRVVALRFSRDDWIAIHDEATKETAEKGQARLVQQDHAIHADPRHPMGGKDHWVDASNGQLDVVPPSQPNPGEGQTAIANSGHGFPADARAPLPGGDQHRSVQQDHATSVPAGQPVASRKGQLLDAQQRRIPSAPPAREPSAADIEALKESGDFHYFQMINLRKKAWSTYRYSQLKNVRSLNMQENMVINDVIDWGRRHKVKEDDLVSLTMPAGEMKKIINHAKNAIPSKAEAISKPATRSARRGR